MMGASLLVNKTHLAFVTEEIFLPTFRMLDVNVKMNFLLLFTSVITVGTFSVLFNLMFGPYVISQFVFWYSRKSTFFTNLQYGWYRFRYSSRFLGHIFRKESILKSKYSINLSNKNLALPLEYFKLIQILFKIKHWKKSNYYYVCYINFDGSVEIALSKDNWAWF